MHVIRRAVRGTAILVGILVCINASASSGATVYVTPTGNDANDGLTWATAKLTVAAGLARATSGDQVWVAAGTYVGCIELTSGVALYGGFAGTEDPATFDLASRDFATHATILDGNKAGSVVRAPYGATSTTRIDGFTIRNGSRTSSDTFGGGVYCDSSSPTIANCTITGNKVSSSHGGGGGIYCGHSSPTITHCTIAGNKAADYGGGIYCAESSSPMIANCTITGNNAYLGGGVCCDASSPTIVNCAIAGNGASGGGGVYSQFASPTIINSTLVGNSDFASGGGVSCYSSSLTIGNTIVAFNSSGICGSYTSVTSRYNCVYGNKTYDYSGVTDPTGTDGNISADPMLVDLAYGNTHIQPGSSCVGAGDDTMVQAGWLDMDGQLRVQGSHVDIGADESDGTSYAVGPYAIVRVSADGDDSRDGSSWEQAKRTVQAGIDAAAAVGGDVWVRSGTYAECITLPSCVYLYGGFAGTEDAREERNWQTNETILDGQQRGSVVTALTGYQSSRLDGFSVRNGTGTLWGLYTSGGGVYCEPSSSPTIANCTITGNTVSAAESGGGGIYCGDFSWPAIINCAIKGHAAFYGSGIFCGYKSSPAIANCEITGGSATYGGGVDCSSSSATITNCTIAGNSASSDGGGIYSGDWSSGTSTSCTITNCTIAGNTASSNGGGVYCGKSTTLTITNTITAFNSSGIYGSGSTPALRHNCVYDNGAYNYSGLTDPTRTDGNISADPKLANFTYAVVRHIQPDSPCVDAGDSTAVQAGWLDIDGQTRIQGNAVDIGADESDGTTWPEEPPVIVRVSRNGSDAGDGSSWEQAKLTVQAGINAAAALGGEVWVQSGTYSECITLPAHVNLYGGFAGTENVRLDRNWRTHETILDGKQGGSVVTATTGHRVSRVDGFTIRNGSGTVSDSSTCGGGVYCDKYCSPTIANCTITGNSVSSHGGGIYCNELSSPAIVDCTIAENIAFYGGGMYCNKCASATITRCTIARNKASGSSAYGGGIYFNASSATMANCTITGNTASDSYGFGGGIYCNSSSPTVTDCTIAGNNAYSSGGGIYCNSSSPTITRCAITGNSSTSGGGIYCISSSPTIARCAITGNSSTSGGGIHCLSSSPTIADCTIAANGASSYGGGVYCGSSPATIVNSRITANGSLYGAGVYCRSSSPTIANCTITGNNGYDGGGVYCMESSSPTIINTIMAFNSSGIYSTASTPTLRYNCVYGNKVYNYSGVTDPTGTNGNMSADPKLAGTIYGRVRLQPGSPCVDAGDSTVVQAGWLDIDGQTRIQGNAVDIGADESDGTAWPEGPSIVVRVSPAGDDANDGSSWQQAKRTVQAGIDTVAAQGGEVWVQSGTYTERVTVPSFVYLYGGFAGTENAKAERNWHVNETILDGQQGGSVVTTLSGYQVSRIDGFTIRNGSGTLSGSCRRGGGVFCSNSSPTIANCRIEGNTVTGTLAQGGGVYCTSSFATLVNCMILGNLASSDGAGVAFITSLPTILNCTIVGNSSSSGSVIWSGRSFGLTIANSIVAFNSSGISSGANTTLRYNCIYANPSGTSSYAGTNGNISVDPMFRDKDAGDYRVAAGSPCVDAGDNAAVPGDVTDLDGDGNTTEPQPFDLAGLWRFIDGPGIVDTGAGTAPIVDMGAYENIPAIAPDFDEDGDVDADDLESFEACATGPAVTYDPQALPTGCMLASDGDGFIAADFDTDGDVDHSDFGLLQRCLSGAGNLASAACMK